MSESVHYVMILEIQKITKNTNSIYDNSLRRTVEVESGRSKTEVARIVISDEKLSKLIDRGGKHLALVEETEVK